jgi:hypothetical protein
MSVLGPDRLHDGCRVYGCQTPTAKRHSPNAPTVSCRLITLPFLSAQGKKKIKLFVGYGARIGREVDASHQLSDAVPGIVIDARSFGLSFSIRHGCLP